MQSVAATPITVGLDSVCCLSLAATLSRLLACWQSRYCYGGGDVCVCVSEMEAGQVNRRSLPVGLGQSLLEVLIRKISEISVSEQSICPRISDTKDV